MYTCMSIYVCSAPYLANSKRKKKNLSIRSAKRKLFESKYFHISVNTWVWLFRFKCDWSTHSLCAECSSCTAEPVILNRFPKRECSSSWHPGAVSSSLELWSDIIVILPNKKQTVDSELRRCLLKIQMLIHQCWKYKNSDSHMSVQISSPFPRWKCRCCAVFPESAHWIQKKTYFGPLQTQVPLKVLVCALTTHPCACFSYWMRPSVSEKLDKCPKEQKASQQHGGNVIWEQMGHTRPRGGILVSCRTIFTFVIKERADLTVLCTTCAAGVTQRGRVWWCSFSLCSPLQSHSSTSPRSLNAFFTLNRIAKGLKLAGSLLLGSLWR